jgi:signal transduction histidine kinase
MTSLLLDTPLDTRQREFAETIRASGEHLLLVINDILDFSKIESGHLELDPHPFDLRRAIEDGVDLVAQQASAKGLDLVVDIATDVPRTVVMDSGRLRQVVANLLSNAVKFTETGEVVLSVRVISAEPSNVIEVCVCDTGVGISPEAIARLFQPFSQADASTTRRFGGTGLGLVISRRLVELFGGTIWRVVQTRRSSCSRVSAAYRRGLHQTSFRRRSPSRRDRAGCTTPS